MTIIFYYCTLTATSLMALLLP